MTLDCGVCVVRDWSRADRAALVRAANNRNVWRNLTDMFPHPYTEASADAWLGFLEKQHEPTAWAIEVDGVAAGGIGVTLRDGIYARTAEFGYWLGEPFWRRGVMSAAARAVADYALDHYNLIRLDAAVFAWNPVSMRVLEKCGFEREAVLRASAVKDGQVVDRVMYARLSSSASPRVRPDPDHSPDHQ